MKKTLLLSAFLLSNVLCAQEFVPPPTVECRFGALLESGRVGLDEVAGYSLFPGSGIVGRFHPYEFEITMVLGLLSVEVFLDGDIVSSVHIPVANVISLPLGATVFGLNRVYHEEIDEFVALQYECIRVL